MSVNAKSKHLDAAKLCVGWLTSKENGVRLAPLTGQDRPVRDYVLGQPGAGDFLDAYVKAVRIALAGYDRAGRHFVALAVGC